MQIRGCQDAQRDPLLVIANDFRQIRYTRVAKQIMAIALILTKSFVQTSSDDWAAVSQAEPMVLETPMHAFGLCQISLRRGCLHAIQGKTDEADMRIAEQVTFGGGGRLNRAADIRGDAPALAALRARPDARWVLLWRGKPLLDFEGEAVQGLALLQASDLAPLGGLQDEVFLGLDAGKPVFAAELKGWEPAVDVSQVGAFLDPSQQAHPDLPTNTRFAELRANMTALTAGDAELVATAMALLNWHRSHQFCARCGQPSRMVQAGWQRSCEACGGQHYPRTDPVVIMLITHGHDLLLGRSIGWPEGMYSLLAGFVEHGETLEAAVRREVSEEAGIDVGPVEYLASQPWPFPNSLMFGCRGTALTKEITLDPVELEDAFWISRTELAAVFAGTSDRIKPARKGSIAEFLMRNWLADRLD